MSSTLNLAIQIKAADMFSAVLNKFRSRIVGMGKDAKNIQKDYDNMTRHITAGLKSLAVSAYTINKIKPGVSAAGDLQEAMLGVKQELGGSAKNAAVLARQLSAVRRTAVSVSSNLPFSAEDVVRIETNLIKSGLALKNITGKSGAAFSAAALAALTKQAPEMIGKSLANIGAQFNFSGSQFNAASDWMVRVSSAAAISVPELIQGLRMSGSSAAALGIKFEDTATSLATLAPLGELAGTSLNRFLAGVKGNTPKAIKMMKALNLTFFDNGKFVGMDKGIRRLRVAMKTIPDDQQRMIVLQQIFGEEGQRAALGFINAKKGFKEIEQAGQGALSMAQKLAIWGTGFNASMEKITGTSRSTLATLFDPMLGPLTDAINKMNELTGALGIYAEKHKSVSQGVSLGLGGLAIGASAYAAYKLTRGGLSGSKVFKAVLGKGGGTATTAAGIAKGKAIEAATGVQPVFVTNWPDGFGGAGVATETAAAAAGGGIFSKLKELSGKLLGKRSSLLANLASKGALGASLAGGVLRAGAGTAATGITAAGAVGYGAGTIINKLFIDETTFGNAIGRNINRIMAALGNKTSRDALAAEGTVHIKIDSEGRPRISEVKAKNMNLEVDTGHIPVGH